MELYFGVVRLIASEFLYLQKKAIRTMYGLSNLTSCRDTFKANKLLTLPSLYIKEIIMHVKTNSNLFVNNNIYHDYDTRGKDDLCIPKHNFTISEKKSLLHRY